MTIAAAISIALVAAAAAMAIRSSKCPMGKCPHWSSATKYPRKCYYEPQCWRGKISPSQLRTLILLLYISITLILITLIAITMQALA